MIDIQLSSHSLSSPHILRAVDAQLKVSTLSPLTLHVRNQTTLRN